MEGLTFRPQITARQGVRLYPRWSMRLFACLPTAALPPHPLCLVRSKADGATGTGWGIPSIHLNLLRPSIVCLEWQISMARF
jgi:hypothetical protein